MNRIQCVESNAKKKMKRMQCIEKNVYNKILHGLKCTMDSRLLCLRILVRAKCKHFPHELWWCQTNIVTAIIWNVVLSLRNFVYDWGVGWFCRHVRWKISAHVDRRPGRGSTLHRPGSEDLLRHERKFVIDFGLSGLRCIAVQNSVTTKRVILMQTFCRDEKVYPKCLKAAESLPFKTLAMV